MDKVILDAALRARFGDLTSPFPIFDESGKMILYVTPVNDPSLYVGIDCGAPDDELERRVQAGGGRPLTAILADLEAGLGPMMVK